MFHWPEVVNSVKTSGQSCEISIAGMPHTLLFVLVSAAASDASRQWLDKRQRVLSTIWADGRLPTTRITPDHVRRSKSFDGVTWLTWDITGEDGHPMNATVWYHPIREGARSDALCLMHQGHSNSVFVPANFSAWVHQALGCDYAFLWMPLYGVNRQHGYPPHHSFFAKWEAEGVRTLRYFLEPTALTINYALSTLGYSSIYASGLSGGGWATTVYAAIDPRVSVSLPVAGSLPWYLFADHEVGDWEQRPQPNNAEWYLTRANLTELYLLAALERGRTSVQVLHENDPCCFHAHGRHATIRGYVERVQATLGARGGGHFTTAVSDWAQHMWDERSRAIVAAALAEATTHPAHPDLRALPCDILLASAPSSPAHCPAANGASLQHPGVLVGGGGLDARRWEVEHRQEPAHASFLLAMVGRVQAYDGQPPVDLGSLAYKPHPQQLHSNGSGITPFREDAFAAYTHALLWAIELDPRHARKAIEIMDGWADPARGWSQPVDLANGLQIAWAGAVWPRAAELIRQYYTAPWEGAAAFGQMLTTLLLPQVDEGASTNGNIGLVMTEACVGIAVYTDDRPLFETCVARWKEQAAAYLYVASDGPTPRRPPAQRYLAHTWPTCGPACTDDEMRTYWHGQAVYGKVAEGVCQETCRDLGHVQLGFATLVNTAETAFIHGVDLYTHAKERMVASAELHASLLAQEPAPLHQPVPHWMCGGHMRGAGANVTLGTWDMLRSHFSGRLQVPMPHVSALLAVRGNRRDACWDQMCWETLTHGTNGTGATFF